MHFWIPSIGYLKKNAILLLFSFLEPNPFILYFTVFHYLNFEIAKDICLIFVFLYAREIYLLSVDLGLV